MGGGLDTAHHQKQQMRQRQHTIRVVPVSFSSQFENNYFTEMCRRSEAGSY